MLSKNSNLAAKYILVATLFSSGMLRAQDALTTDEVTKEWVDPREAEQRDFSNFSYYKPLYALYGKPTSKIQLSFKYQLTKQLPLYIAYTQLSFWDLSKKSSPFDDIIFNPEIFYRLNFERYNFLESIEFIPISHRSNGRAGMDSRSLNYSGIKINQRSDFRNWSLKTFFKAKYYFGIEDTNRDVRNYEGPWELGFSLVRYGELVFDKIELSARAFTGGKKGLAFHRGAQEVSLSLRVLGVSFSPTLYLQYYKGYSESFLEYKKRVDQLRIGLVL